MFDHLNKLSETKFDYNNRNFDENIDVLALADAVYRVSEANSRNLEYDVRVNDHHIWQYHKNNGFTKMSIEDH